LPACVQFERRWASWVLVLSRAAFVQQLEARMDEIADRVARDRCPYLQWPGHHARVP
jgi:hypothetical protein